MTENKPVAWAYEFYSVSQDVWVTDCVGTTDPANYTGTMTRNIEPLYRHPPAPTDAKPVAWAYEYYNGFQWKTLVSTLDPLARGPDDTTRLRNVRSLYEHPPAPQPDPDPAVEAARRKALRAIFAALAKHPEASDWTPVMLERAVLRDLVGQPRKNPEQSVKGYDPEPLTGEFLHEFHKAALHLYAQGVPSAEPLKTSATMIEQRVSTSDLREPRYDFEHKPPARLSVNTLAAVIRTRAGLCLSDLDASMCTALAQAVHEAVYGKDA